MQPRNSLSCDGFVFNTPIINYPDQKKDKYVKKTQAKGMQADFQPCGMCKKQFRSKASLDQHIRVIHHKIKGYVCHLCHKSFGYKKTLDGHISVMHENSGKVSILEVESLLPFLHGFSRWVKNTPSLYNLGVNKISSKLEFLH